MAMITWTMWLLTVITFVFIKVFLTLADSCDQVVVEQLFLSMICYCVKVEGKYI